MGEKKSHSDFKETVLLENLHIQSVLLSLKTMKKQKFKDLIQGFFSPVYTCYSFCVFFHVDGNSRWDNFTTASISFSDPCALVELLLVEK